MATEKPVTNPIPYPQLVERYEKLLDTRAREHKKSLCRIFGQRVRKCLGTLLDHPLVYGIVWEIRTAPRRIQFLRQYRLDMRLDPGPDWGVDPSGHPFACRRKHARILDKQTLSTTLPWASPVEQMMFLEGWDLGADWALHTQCNEDGVKDSWRDQCISDCSRPNRMMRPRSIGG
jgi:hypothetical protein